MTKRDIKVGSTYTGKVSGRLAHIRIDGIAPSGGYYATNVATGRQIRLRTAGRLRSLVEPINRLEYIRSLRAAGLSYEQARDQYVAEHPPAAPDTDLSWLPNGGAGVVARLERMDEAETAPTSENKL